MIRADVSRDISYASAAQSRAGRVLIRALEQGTGRNRVIARAAGYEHEISSGRSFWQVMPERFGLQLDVLAGDLAAIPSQGPLVMIANHPYGILDGLMMGHLLDRLRGDFRILANSVFVKAPDLRRVILPISFDPTPEAVALNLQTRREALSYLADGGAIGVFPGGTVSTSAKPLFAKPLDPGWRNFTAKLIQRSGATVVPVFFTGHNSRLFQIASHLHYTLRLGLLIKEFRARLDRPVQVVIGKPIPAADLAGYGSDARGMMDFLRAATYALSPDPIDPYALGHEFEAKYKTR
ncbi:lysophospholipid acyltransferase family protein [Gemmobacter denitrificans]|uniref:Lysophospholipid acyltransferase family protein n=1 Tax=Gemmobacter denitrificans TaxID=3123040 RepID=A0ABU8BQ14_9RHOB